MRKGGKQHSSALGTRPGHVWAPVVLSEAADGDALRDELYQEVKDALEAELGVSLKGRTDEAGWLELRLDRSDDVIDRAIDVIKNVMWMVSGEKPTVKMTARGAKVYNSFAVASPEMLPNHVDNTNTFSLVMRMHRALTGESKVKTTMGEIRRLLREADQGDNLVDLIIEELYAQLSEKHTDIQTSGGHAGDKQHDKLSFRTSLSLADEQKAIHEFGDIIQTAFDCLREVTGDEPKITMKPHPAGVSGAGLFASIETHEVRASVAMNTHGWTYVTVTRLANVQEATQQAYQSLLDKAMDDMLSVNKTLEKAHEQAPAGVPKAIIMGLHSDVFNTVATFREYLGKLKGLKEARARHRSKKDGNALHAVAKEFVEEVASQFPGVDVQDYSEYAAKTDDVVGVEMRLRFDDLSAVKTNELWKTIRNVLWVVSGIEPSDAPREGDRYMTLGNSDFAVARIGNTQEIRIIALDEKQERLDLREARETQEPDTVSQVYEELLQACKDEFGEGTRERPDLSDDDGSLKTFSTIDVRGTSFFTSRAVIARQTVENVLWVVTGQRPVRRMISDWHEMYSTDDVLVTLDMRSRETYVCVDTPRLWGHGSPTD